MVFSMMHLIGVDIDVNYKRPLSDLYIELTEKAAYKGYPAWLTIGDLHGDRIPRDPLSGIRPELPMYRGRDPPTYFGGTLTTENFVSAYNNYVYKFDLVFKAHSGLGHLVCAHVLDIKQLYTAKDDDFLRGVGPEATLRREVNRDEPELIRLRLSDSEEVKGLCCYRGEIGDVMIVIGQRAKFESPFQYGKGHAAIPGDFYVYFASHCNGGWRKVGAGLFEVHHGKMLGNRRHITFGWNSPRKILPCDCDNSSHAARGIHF